LLRISINSKSKNKVIAKIQLVNKTPSESRNTYVPITGFKEMLTPFSEGTLLCHIIKIDPARNWDDIDVIINANEINPVPQAPS